ncbi:MAG: DUF1501 domain-containing protein [Vicinamibacterales bacterium]
MHRRTFVRMLCLGGLATLSAPVVTFGQVRQPGRFVFVLLRGGVDGLAAVVPYGDPEYAATRGALALDAQDLVPLDDTFALAPGLASLRELWEADELAVLHALAIPYRTRSHFDGQAVLETGLDRPAGAADGWLNRVLQVLEGQRSAIAIAAGVPRSLVGPHDVQTWSPAQLGVVDEGYLARLAVLYRADTALATRFDLALRQESLVGEETAARGNAAAGATTALFEATARILTQDGAPNIAALEFSGWDTHANQGVGDGALDRRLAQLAEGLLAFRTAMADTWAGTTVVVMTEFGRTARPNGTRGTDHGTAGAGFVLGSTLARAAVLADWPGLSATALFEGRDLRPTLDTRTVLRAALAGTFDMTDAQLDRVFPGTTGRRDALALMR